MARYGVVLTTVASTVIYVDAENEEQAEEEAFNTDRSLSLMFLDHKYPDTGEWETAEVFEVEE